MTVDDETVCVAPTGYFAGALGAAQGSASPLHDSVCRALDPPGALPRRGSYRSDAGSQLLDGCEHIGV